VHSQRMTAKRWATVKGPAGLWNPRTEYKAVGRTPGSPYDEVRSLFRIAVPRMLI
jgi:hypothetical protein